MIASPAPRRVISTTAWARSLTSLNSCPTSSSDSSSLGETRSGSAFMASRSGSPSVSSMVITQDGIVAAESPLAAQAGVEMLKRGGNAVDAAIAANAVMGVVAPMSNGIGGDLFVIYYDAKSGKLYGLNASGPAPAALNAQLLREKYSYR